MGKILSKIRSTRQGYNLGRTVLASPFITNNVLYKKLYRRKINNVIKNLKYPMAVDIGVTNYCNASCIMCPHSKLTKMGIMDMKLFKKIIDNCKKLGIFSVLLSFFGEPLIDKELIKKIKYAKSKQMKVAFYSNASLLTKKWAEDLIMAGLDGSTISFDGNSKETYEKIRKNLNFEIVRENIRNLIKIRKKLNKKNPQIKLVLVELNENKKEIKDFYREWKGKVDGINIINMRNWANEADVSKMGTKESFHFKKDLKRYPCALIWHKMVVDWNGDVVLCCDDWNHSTVLGNLKTQSIEEVWNGKRIRKIKEYHLSGQFDKIPLCKNCNKKSVWWLL